MRSTAFYPVTACTMALFGSASLILFSLGLTVPSWVLIVCALLAIMLAPFPTREGLRHAMRGARTS